VGRENHTSFHSFLTSAAVRNSW